MQICRGPAVLQNLLQLTAPDITRNVFSEPVWEPGFERVTNASGPLVEVHNFALQAIGQLPDDFALRSLEHHAKIVGGNTMHNSMYYWRPGNASIRNFGSNLWSPETMTQVLPTPAHAKAPARASTRACAQTYPPARGSQCASGRTSAHPHTLAFTHMRSRLHAHHAHEYKHPNSHTHIHMRAQHDTRLFVRAAPATHALSLQIRSPPTSRRAFPVQCAATQAKQNALTRVRCLTRWSEST
eukprot:6181001-Pleurochrysis_carterae.AAC.2